MKSPERPPGEVTPISGARPMISFSPPLDLDDVIDRSAPALEQVVALRRELFRSLPTGPGAVITELDHRAKYQEIAASLSAGDKGLWCAGAAFVFQRALEALGFRSWILHYGFADDATHTLNVVSVDDRLLVQDCYLNQGCDLNLPELLDTLATGRTVEFRAEARDRKPHLIPLDDPQRDWFMKHAAAKLPPIAGLARFTLFPQSHRERATRSFTGLGMQRLRELGLPEDPRFLMLNPTGVFDGEGFHADPATMPLVSDWLARGGRTLTQRREAKLRSADDGDADQRLLLEDVATRLREERRAWFAQRLDLEAQLDAAQYDASLWRRRHGEEEVRAIEACERAAIARAEADSLRAGIDARLAEVRTEAESQLALARVDAETQRAEAESRLVSLRAEADAQLASAQTRAGEDLAAARADGAGAERELAALRAALAKSRYLRLRRWVLRALGVEDNGPL